MIVDILNTILEFIAVLMIFSIFCGRKFWTYELFIFFPISIILSVYFCLPIPHYLYINSVLFILSLYVSFHSVAWRDRLIAAVTALFLLTTIEFILLSFLPLIILHTYMGDLAVNLIMVLLISVICFLIYKRNYSPILLTYIQRYFLVIVVILILWCFLGQTYLKKAQELWAYIPGLVSLGILLLFCLGIVLDILYQRSIEHKKICIYEKNMQTIDLYIDQLKRENHDYKHHICYLIDLMSTSQHNEAALLAAKNYVCDLEASHRITDSILAIDSIMYKAILFGAYNRCQKSCIPFSLECSAMLPDFPLKEYQIVEILENLISNAIEYNQALPVGERNLKVSLLADKMNNQFSITNTFIEQEKDLSEFFKKGKTNKPGHHLGYGMYSITDKIRQAGMDFYVKKNLSEKSITFILRYYQQPKSVKQ